MSLKTKLAISLIFTSAVLLVYTILFEYTNSSDQLFAIQERSLEAIADLKVAAINNYFSKLKDEAAAMQNNHDVRMALSNTSGLAATLGESDRIAIKKNLDAQFQSWLGQRQGAITDVMLLDVNGKVIYVLSPQHALEFDRELHDPCNGNFLRGRHEIYISDLHPDWNRKSFSFSIFAPILDFDNKFSGELVIEVASDGLDAMLQNRSGLGETGETELGRLITIDSAREIRSTCFEEHGNAVLFLNSLRSDPGSKFAHFIEIGSPGGKAIQAAAQGADGSGVYTDYAGVQALAVWRYLPDRHWGIVTKIDLVELLMPARQVVKSSLIFGPVIFLVLILIAVRLAGAISTPLVKLTTIARKIGEGHLDVEFDDELIFAENETGVLATTMKKSVATLKNVYANLEKRVQERTAQISEARVREEAILSSIGDGVIAVDEKGVITFTNSAAEKMLRLKNSDLAGKKIIEVITIQDESGNVLPPEEGPIIQALTFGKSTIMGLYPKISYFARGDKSRFPVSITTTPVRLQNKVIGAIEIFRDITSEHEIDKAKTEFVSLASHQLKTPLTAIGWYAEMLMNGDLGKITGEQRKFLSQIYKSNRRMLALIGALLNVSRIELGTLIIEPEPTDFIALVRNVILEVMPEVKEKTLKLKTDFDPIMPLINIDPRLARIVVQNLLTNAVKYTPKNGKIKIIIKNDNANVLLSIADTGLGIPEIAQSKIFEKLYRADNVQQSGIEGTGLGLYLVKSIINFIDGKIWFESEEKKGSTFYVSLPVAGVKRRKGTKFLQ